MSRPKVIDEEGFSIQVGSNYGTTEEAIKKYKNNSEADVAFIAIEDLLGRQQCVALSISKTSQLIDILQSLVKCVKEG